MFSFGRQVNSKYLPVVLWMVVSAASGRVEEPMLKLGEPEKRWHPRRWRAWTSVFYIVFCIVDANRLPESVAQYAKVCTASFRLEFTAVVTQTFTKDGVKDKCVVFDRPHAREEFGGYCGAA